MEEIRAAFDFGEWKVNEFRQCGCDMYRDEEGDHHLHQRVVCDNMKEIQLVIIRNNIL